MTRFVPILLLVAAVPCVLESQRGGFRGSGAGWRGGSDFTEYNVPYDGRFTFARLSFTPANQGGWGRGRGRQLYWDHDWPIAENNLLKLLRELTDVRPYMEGSNILAADDPDQDAVQQTVRRAIKGAPKALDPRLARLQEKYPHLLVNGQYLC